MGARGTAMAIAVLSGVLAHQGSAVAETSDELVERGIRSMHSGAYESALRDFIDANAHDPTPKAVAEIGLAEQALNRWADAESHLTLALGAATDPWIQSHQPILATALVTVKGHLGWLVVSGTPAGAEVRLDDRLLGTIPLDASRVPIGGHALDVRADRYKPLALPVIVSPGERKGVEVSLDKEQRQLSAAVSATSVPPIGNEVASPDRSIAWIAIGAGAIVGTFGAIFYKLGDPRLGVGGIAVGAGGIIGASAGLVVLQFP